MARGDDGGQMLLLAGIVLVLGFVVTAYTLAQVADVEKKAAQEQDQSFVTEYRFLRTKLGTILSGSVGRTTDNASFNSTLAATIGSFRNTLATKGYDSTIVLAGNATGLGRTECTYLVNGCPRPGAIPPAVKSWSPSVVPVGATAGFTHRYDGKSDGIVWRCGSADGLIVGAVIHIAISDGRTAIEETVLYGTNLDFTACGS